MATDPILNWGQLSAEQRRDARSDRNDYMKSQRKFARILTQGEWMSTHRDINIFDGDDVTSFERTDGNNYKFYRMSPTQLKAINSYIDLSGANPTTYTIDWIVQLNPRNNTFILRDAPTTPTREAFGHYDRKTDSILLSINGPAGPVAQPFDTPAWGVTTNHYTHIVGPVWRGETV
jgi:hypothetical protein